MSDDPIAFARELSGRLAALPGRPPKGELLARSKTIPLIWPDSEFPPGRALDDQFGKALLPWGAKIHRAATARDAAGIIAGILKAEKIARAGRWRTPRLDSIPWAEATAENPVEWIQPAFEEARESMTSPDARRAALDRYEKIEAGFIDCDAAAAHTGTLIIRHGPERQGMTNLLPWTCVALVWTDQLIPSLAEAPPILIPPGHTGKPSASMIFLTGPSRSGDIDLAAGQGAAGPGRMDVILIAEPSPPTGP